MSTVDLDLASAVSLLGAAVDDAVLCALSAAELRGLRPAHGYLVQRLLVGPATGTEIAAALGVSQQAVSKALKELLDLGYAQPCSDGTDRRRHPVELSAQGRRAVDVARAARADIARRIEAAAGEDRTAVAHDVLITALDVVGMGGRVRRRSVSPPAGALDETGGHSSRSASSRNSSGTPELRSSAGQ
jgi:DNA-binding MarR family transcriptional regulator